MHPDKRTQLIKLLGMLGSAHDGEVLNAAKMAQRLLGAEGETWEEAFKQNGHSFTRDRYQEGYTTGFAAGLAQATRRTYNNTRPRMTWFAFARTIQENHYDYLNDWEQGFIDNWIERHWNNPSPKQRAVFERMADKLGLDCPET